MKSLKTTFFASMILSFLASPAIASSWEDRLGIIQGQTIDDQEPIAKAIVRLKSDSGGCSGLLLADNVVLTAAHCVMGGVGTHGTQVISYANPLEKCSTTKVEIAAFHPSAIPDPDDASKSKLPDIAVLKLERHLCGVRAAKLNPDFFPEEGAITTVAGFGIGTKNEDHADRIELKFLPARREALMDLYLDAGLKWQETVGQLFDRSSRYYTFLLPEKEGTSMCMGDSGGPAYSVREGTIYSMGVNGAIMGHPIKGAPECKNAYLNMITPVKPYLEWILGRVIEWKFAP